MERLASLIAEFQQRSIPDLTARDVELPVIPGMADLVVGVRRCGKTYRLYQEMQRLRAEGVPTQRILYLNLEDDRLQPADVSLLGEAIETFYRLSPSARVDGAHLLFDEVQAVDGWSRFLRRVLDTENARVYASGSSAKLLSTEVSTEFRGRGFAVELLPFSFREVVRHAGVEVPRQLPGARLRTRLEALFLRYLYVGGFPAVQNLAEPDLVQTLQDYVDLVLLRDIVERHRISNVAASRRFVRALLQSTGRLFTVNKTYNAFRSQGIEVGKDTLHALLAHVEDAFLAFAIPRFAASQRVREMSPKKIYPIDPGLARAMSHISVVDVGSRLETAVYLELRRRLRGSREGSISHYVTAGGREIDFVLGVPEDLAAARLVQVCADLSVAATRERELGALAEGMAELSVREATLITLHTRKELETPSGPVHVVPAWQWMLGL
ncbi:MAG: ATP-binding protein [Acidobacteriota bacterium]